MANEQTSTSDLFRRAQALRSESPNASYKDIRDRLVKEFSGKQPQVHSAAFCIIEKIIAGKCNTGKTFTLLNL